MGRGQAAANECGAGSRQDDDGRPFARFSPATSAPQNSKRTWSARFVLSHPTMLWRCCPGSDPRLKSEAVLYTAHYDHLGIRPDMPGDNIYNGANDNATGCGILLELARAYLAGRKRSGGGLSFSRRSRPKSRACLDQNIWATSAGACGQDRAGP